MPGRPGEVREEARHSLGCPVQGTGRERQGLGARGRKRMGELAQVLARRLVRRAALLQMAGEQGLQDAHPGAAVEISRLHALPGLPRHAAQAGLGAVEAEWAFHSRLDAAAFGQGKRIFQRHRTSKTSGSPAHRDPHAPQIPLRRRPGLPDPRPPVAHPVGRRSTAHQPHDRARHLARQHAVRAGRALGRPAPARHGTS